MYMLNMVIILIVMYCNVVTAIDKIPTYLLHFNTYLGHVELVELLIRYGADVDSRHNSWTPLHSAALQGRLDIVKLLLKSGADRDIQNQNDKTPLDLAFDNGKFEVANFLSRSVTSPDGMLDPSVSPQSQHPNVLPWQHEEIEAFKNQYSLFTAAENGRIDVVRSLLELGADVDEMDSLRQTALAVASTKGKLRVAELLIEHDADVNSRDMHGWTPLHTAARYGHLDVVRLLLNQNADLNAFTRNLRTALDLASIYGQLEVVELLLDRGANANVRNIFGRTLQQEALAYGYTKIAELLAQHSARQT